MPGNINRKFFYDKNGHVIKKLYFDENGRIEKKESSIFDGDRIIQNTFITDSEFQRELYYYDKKHSQTESYDFFTPEKGGIKSEYYSFDKQGRKSIKKSIGFGGIEELFTRYIYKNDEDKKYAYREVHSTDPDKHGELLMTLAYIINKRGKLTGLYGFIRQNRCDVEALMESYGWKTKSDFRTEWKYDRRGNYTSLITDEKPPLVLNNPLVKHSDFSKDFGYEKDDDFAYKKGNEITEFKASRIITRKSTFEYALIKNETKVRLAKVIDWLPRFDEPFKAIRKYTYFDKDGIELEWDKPSDS